MQSKLRMVADTWRKGGLTEVAAGIGRRIVQPLTDPVLFARFLREAQALQMTEPRALVEWMFARWQPLVGPAQDAGELVRLLERVREKRPQTIVEIGTHRGGTLFLFTKMAAPDATIISIDLPYGIHGGGYPKWREALYARFAGPHQTMHFIRDDSTKQAVRDDVEKMLAGKSIDFLFIDGDHRYEGVKTDFEMYEPFVADGGLVAFHDIVQNRSIWPDIEVDRFWKEVKAQYSTEEIISSPSAIGFGIGVVTIKRR